MPRCSVNNPRPITPPTYYAGYRWRDGYGALEACLPTYSGSATVHNDEATMEHKLDSGSAQNAKVGGSIASQAALRDKNGAELFRDLTKTARIALHYLPESSELFLQTEHRHLDGRGIMRFWDRFSEAVIEPKGGGFRGRDSAAASQGGRPPGPRREVAWVRQGDRAGHAGTPFLRRADLDAGADVSALPGRNFSAELKFSVRGTSAILQECRRKKFTATAVWHAAMALATRDTQTQAGPKKPTGGGDDPNDDAYTVSNHRTVLSVVAEPAEGRTFDDLAGELTAFCRRGISEPPGVWGALRPMIEEITTPAVSSLGNVDRYVRRRYGAAREIEGVWFGDTATGPWLEGFLWAWRDCLVLCSCYDSGLYTPRDVQAFHERAAQIMMEGLGLYERARL
ncbi:hypothetical protein DL765_004333 [Monosporascus sp. GIB2]|nr:hypothetical protein DL765_004333 [Monosporascus sp. GIB2]